MIIKPRVRGFVCVTAHPAGCAAHVQEWIDHVKGKGADRQRPEEGPGDRRLHRLRPGLPDHRRFRLGSGDGRRLFRAPVRGGPPGDARLVQLHRLHPEGARGRALCPESQRRRLFRRNQAPDDRRDPRATWARSTWWSTAWPRPGARIRGPARSTSRSSSRSARPTRTRRSTPTRASSARSRSSRRPSRRSPTRSPSWAARTGRCGCRRWPAAGLLAPGAQSGRLFLHRARGHLGDLQERHDRDRQERPGAGRPGHRRATSSARAAAPSSPSTRRSSPRPARPSRSCPSTSRSCTRS